MRRRIAAATAGALCALALAALPAGAGAAEECDLIPRTECFGIESVDFSLSENQAGAHPDLDLDVEIKQDPESEPNVFGLKDSYAAVRNIRFNAPPGLIGDPNVLGVPQQCKAQELINFATEGCPNGSQVGISTINAYGLLAEFREPLYMMEPPAGDVVARVGTVAGIFPTFIDFKVRSEDDYGLVAEVREAPSPAKLIRLESTFWGVPADPSHDTERCTLGEAFSGCVFSEKRPPGSLPLPFLTNPTLCGAPLSFGVNASSWVDLDFDPLKEVIAAPETIFGCNNLPFGPGLTIEPTNHRAAAPTGLDITIRAPASDGVDVLEPAQIRDIRVTLPLGLAINPSAGDGQETCSAAQVKFKERVAAQCPDAAKMADFEAEIAALPRRLKGAIYLREPEPGNPFRVWAVADDLGAHVKLPGQLSVDKQTGQIQSVFLDTPQVPMRELKLVFKSGYRAPLVNPQSCGTYASRYEFISWAQSPFDPALSPIAIDEGCGEVGGFDPRISAGTSNPAAGAHSPLLFTLTRDDGDQNPRLFDFTLPSGFAASFADIPRCQGDAALSGACPAASRIGRVVAAVGSGPTPLWVPQPGKRPSAVYLAGPYKGAPLSIVAVVPRQAGPFDFGDEVVRSAIAINPVTARATTYTDPLPQLIEGIPITYRTLHVAVEDPTFALNPTSCAPKMTQSTITSVQGTVANPTSPFTAVNCGNLGFKPQLSFRLRGGTRRGAHPSLKAVVKGRPGDANIAGASVALPRSEFLDQGHIGTVCTRVQFAADNCPAASIYGRVSATTPLFAETLSGPVYLRSSSNPLPDVVAALKGPDSLPIEIELAGRVDSINGGIRNTFEVVPDAPVTSFVLTLAGGDKGLLVNSTNLCAKTNRATAKLTAHNGRKLTLRPVMRASCGKGKGSGR